MYIFRRVVHCHLACVLEGLVARPPDGGTPTCKWMKTGVRYAHTGRKGAPTGGTNSSTEAARYASQTPASVPKSKHPKGFAEMFKREQGTQRSR